LYITTHFSSCQEEICLLRHFFSKGGKNVLQVGHFRGIVKPSKKGGGTMEEGMAQRIKSLRQKRKMTLEQVADIVGVGKSTVRKWETGMIANMRRDKIASLAKALNTTPEYLMGWENKKEISPSEPTLTEGEALMLELFRQIPVDQQPMVLAMIKAALCTDK
jgi:transcriptional regulator with XRE-family HTH domain